MDSVQKAVKRELSLWLSYVASGVGTGVEFLVKPVKVDGLGPVSLNYGIGTRVKCIAPEFGTTGLPRSYETAAP